MHFAREGFVHADGRCVKVCPVLKEIAFLDGIARRNVEETLTGGKQGQQGQTCSYYRESFHLYKISGSIKMTLSGPPGKNAVPATRRNQFPSAADRMTRPLPDPGRCSR